MVSKKNKEFKHLRLSSLGLKKGEVTDAGKRVGEVAIAGRKLLDSSRIGRNRGRLQCHLMAAKSSAMTSDASSKSRSTARGRPKTI